MNGIYKNIIAAGFLLLLALPALLFFTNKVKQRQIKNSRSEKFKTETIQTIIVSKEKVQWAKPGKEIIADGKYFDVMSYVVIENKVHFTGFYDHKEDKIVNALKNLISKNTGTENPYTKSVNIFFFFAVYTQTVDTVIDQLWKLNKFTYPVFSENIAESYIPLYSPPPEL